MVIDYMNNEIKQEELTKEEKSVNFEFLWPIQSKGEIYNPNIKQKWIKLSRETWSTYRGLKKQLNLPHSLVENSWEGYLKSRIINRRLGRSKYCL